MRSTLPPCEQPVLEGTFYEKDDGPKAGGFQGLFLEGSYTDETKPPPHCVIEIEEPQGDEISSTSSPTKQQSNLNPDISLNTEIYRVGRRESDGSLTHFFTYFRLSHISN